MADAGKFAITTYASYAGQDTLLIGFPYLDKDHVKVWDNAATPVQYVRGTDFEIENSAPTVIEWKAGEKPANGLKITITRVTPSTTPINTFVAGKPVLAANINTNLSQVLYFMQEVSDQQ